jgi:hypothetical protein
MQQRPGCLIFDFMMDGISLMGDSVRGVTRPGCAVTVYPVREALSSVGSQRHGVDFTVFYSWAG